MKKDVVIIGAGPSGLALACLLSKLDLNIVVIEKSTKTELENPSYDGRETALTHPSKDLLQEIGAWDRLEKNTVSPINEAKVLNGFSSYSLDFENSKSDGEALGYLVSNHAIRKSLFEQVITLSNVELISENFVEDIKIDETKAVVFLNDNRVFEANLIVAADSRFSKTRTKMGIGSDIHDFARTMIVCKMDHEQTHHNIALECFFEDRVIAALPLHGQTSSIVITLPAKKAEEIVNLSEAEFNADIDHYLSDKLGKLALVSKRYSYPLASVYANKFVAKRFALIGDAAVGMHPVTAHGFNLGLVGQKILFEEIKKAVNERRDIGSDEVLEKYNSKHLRETKLMYFGTNTIVSLFTNNSFPAKILRSAMLRAANSKFLPFKSIISNRLTGNKKFLGIIDFVKILRD